MTATTSAPIGAPAATSRYAEVYAAWKSDPQALLGRGGQGHRLVRGAQDGVRPHMPASMAAGSPAASCNTCHNAVDRHVAAGRGEQTAIIYDSPVTGTKARITYAELQRRGGDASPRCCRSSASSKGDRVIIYMPMIPEAVIAMLPAPGSAPSIRWCSAASPRKSSPPASTTPSPSSSSRPPAASSPNRVVPYKPLLDEAIELAAHKPRDLHHPRSGRRPPPR